MRYVLLQHGVTALHYIARYAGTAETAVLTAAITPDDPLTIASFTGQTFVGENFPILVNCNEVAHYDEADGLIAAPPAWPAAIIEKLFPV